MNKILLVHTSWYQEKITKMLDISIEVLERSFQCEKVQAPGAIELAALARNKMQKTKFDGIIFHGIVIRGETSHYDLVSTETFRSIGKLADDYSDISIINNVICVENELQLNERIEKNTRNNSKALINLIHEKSRKL